MSGPANSQKINVGANPAPHCKHLLKNEASAERHKATPTIRDTAEETAGLSCSKVTDVTLYCLHEDDDRIYRVCVFNAHHLSDATRRVGLLQPVAV